MGTVTKLVTEAIEVTEQVALVVADKLRDFNDDNTNVIYEALAARRNKRLVLEAQKQALAIRARLLEEEQAPRFIGAELSEEAKLNHQYNVALLERKAHEQEIRETTEALAQQNVATVAINDQTEVA